MEKARSLSKQDSLSGESSSWSLTPAGSLPSSTPGCICFGLSTSVASCWVQLSAVRPSCGSWAGTIVYSGQRLCLSSTYCHIHLLWRPSSTSVPVLWVLARAAGDATHRSDQPCFSPGLTCRDGQALRFPFSLMGSAWWGSSEAALLSDIPPHQYYSKSPHDLEHF